MRTRATVPRAPRVPEARPSRAVTKTHSRSYTSSDNPYSEAQLRTLEYRSDLPDCIYVVFPGRPDG